MNISAWDWLGLWLIIAAIVIAIFDIYRKLGLLKERIDEQQEMIDLLHEDER